MKREDIVVSIPHAGTDIPPEIMAVIPHSETVIRNESDLFTDQIYHLHGTRMIKTPYSRVIADVNRAPDEIYLHGKTRATGVVMLDFPTGEAVFDPEPEFDQIQTWVTKFHRPFHAELYSATQVGKFLIDAHSMWSCSAAGHWGSEAPGVKRADILIGNQYFCSCDAETTHFFLQFFENLGYSVSLNDPYPGRYILGRYCNRQGLPGIQIEINRALYLDEETLQPNTGAIAHFNQQLNQLVDEFCDWWQTRDQAKLVDMSEDMLD